MAEHHHPNGDQSLYDFLVDEPEMMAAAAPPSGHLDFGSRPQQPTSASDRTSDEGQIQNPPMNPRHSGHASTVQSGTAAPSMRPLMPMIDPTVDQSSRVESPSHSAIPHPFDLHAHSLPTTASLFARPPLPTTIGHLPTDWGLYGAAHSAHISLNQAPFEFEVPPPNALTLQYSHHPPADPALAVAYGSELVSPTSIHHGGHGHYPFSAPWEDGMDPESSTPTVQMSKNPWVDPEDAQYEEDSAEDSRAKPKGRSKRTKRNVAESPAGALTEPTSPSSVSQHSRASIGSKSASIVSTSSTSSRPSKLRSASRTSKNNLNKPNDTPEERRTRASHNLVEKQYRNRLNAQFESLLNALPEQVRGGGDGEESDGPTDLADRRVSKGEVLEMARKHIQSLERERDLLEKEKNELLGNLQNLKGSNSSEGTTSSLGSHGTPIDFKISMDDDKADGEIEGRD